MSIRQTHYVVHELRLDMMFDLSHDKACLEQLAVCFESATAFMCRVMYLVGLMSALGIVHGTKDEMPAVVRGSSI
jgi:hypothetical protein